MIFLIFIFTSILGILIRILIITDSRSQKKECPHSFFCLFGFLPRWLTLNQIFSAIQGTSLSIS